MVIKKGQLCAMCNTNNRYYITVEGTLVLYLFSSPFDTAQVKLIYRNSNNNTNWSEDAGVYGVDKNTIKPVNVNHYPIHNLLILFAADAKEYWDYNINDVCLAIADTYSNMNKEELL